jgi:glycine cleavage system H protein
VGITAYAQDELGDVVYVDLFKQGTSVAFMGKLGEIESVKVASEIFSPASGEIAAVNEALSDAPELVNADPYGEGWLVTMRLSDPTDIERLLTPEEYRALVLREQGGTA